MSKGSQATAQFNETVQNARRLLSDSEFLESDNRVQSSILLVVLALEELGKAIILRWDTRNKGNNRKFPTHVEKQGAVFSLLAANEILGKRRDRAVKLHREGIFNFLEVGPYSHQLAWARSGFFENLRLSVTYSDEHPPLPREALKMLDGELAKELRGFFQRALCTMRNSEAMALAATIYENDLGRL